MAAGGPGRAYDLQIKVRATLALRLTPVRARPRARPSGDAAHSACLPLAAHDDWRHDRRQDVATRAVCRRRLQRERARHHRYRLQDQGAAAAASGCAAWPLPAARCGPAPPLARRLSTSMARRSSCRFGTPPARCVAPVHHHARSECPVLQVGQAVRRVADPGSATARQERFRTITQAYYRGAMGIFLIYVRRPIRIWRRARRNTRPRFQPSASPAQFLRAQPSPSASPAQRATRRRM